jgi:hypothetical protein
MLNCPLVQTQSDELAPTTGVCQAGWIFELDGSGTVLHSRAHPGTEADPAILEAFGFNFFEDVEGMNTLRQRFRSFVASSKATESFCLTTPNAGQTRILLTKAFQTGMSPPSPLVMMEIRKDPITEHLGGYNGNTTFKLRKQQP